MQETTKKSWFKQFWPWFLILLPMAAVVAGISTVVIAVDNKPDLVVDDYYNTGKAINADLSLLKKAQELGITAIVVPQKDGLMISMDGLETFSSINLSLFHSTQSKRDIVVMLTADANGNYFYENEDTLTGKWTLRVEPFDKKWRLQQKVELPTSKIVL
ncbi:FixH family protein [Psychromonas sp.]|nr:FixH family protein [Psychromonas sp.]